MKAQPRRGQHFLVEWYDHALIEAPLADTAAILEAGAAMISQAGAPVYLELTLAAPTDDVVYGVFGADDAEAVLRACEHAGHPPDRIIADISTRLSVAAGPTSDG